MLFPGELEYTLQMRELTYAAVSASSLLKILWDFGNGMDAHYL
jgi:hypothetical protein